MVTPKPARPKPVMPPNSVFVKPNWSAQSPRMAPRIEKPMPAAISVKKLARKSGRLLFIQVGVERPGWWFPLQPAMQAGRSVEYTSRRTDVNHFHTGNFGQGVSRTALAGLASIDRLAYMP